MRWWPWLYLSLWILLAIGISFFPHLDPNHFDPNMISDPTPPSWHHWFGTDDLGRDLLLRAIYGARISLSVGFLSVSISIALGGFVGVISGWLGGWIDELIMRSVDFMLSLPTLFLILIIQTLFKPNIYTVMAVIGFTSWMAVARLVRAEVLSLKERPFVTACKARGIGQTRILFKHIVPHTLPPIIVTAALGMGSAILTESVLSYLGLGVQPPQASWGNMLQNSLSFMLDAPWMSIIPGVLITLTVLSLNVIGDRLRARVNPQEGD